MENNIAEQLNFDVPRGVTPTNNRRFQTALAIYKMMADWCVERDEEHIPFLAHNEEMTKRAVNYADNFLKELDSSKCDN